MTAIYQNPTVHYIPAQPGWVVGTKIRGFNDDGTLSFSRVNGMHLEPIICWQMVTELQEPKESSGEEHYISTYTNPVTANKTYDCEMDFVIGQPDGKFVWQGIQDFENADEVLAEWRGTARNRPDDESL